mmetsp:Transcript_13411/g.24060  ORF Transcript_13411/g.24060 Transcript_13411/m.24060 type:complete len:611 (-) Transcript_13411:781-2613(-)
MCGSFEMMISFIDQFTILFAVKRNLNSIENGNCESSCVFRSNFETRVTRNRCKRMHLNSSLESNSKVNTKPGSSLQSSITDKNLFPIVSLQNVSYKIGSILILDDISLDIDRGEIVCLLGQTGSGKSTLLRLVAGLCSPSSGKVLSHGKTFNGVNKGAAVVFQSFALFPWLTVQQNVELGLEAQGVPAMERRTRALRAVDTIGLDGYENAFPRELSGGMRQRVGFARALVLQPELLCMDEPFSALDVLTAENLRSELLRLWQGNELPTKAILIVTHGIEEAVSIADRIVVLGRDPGSIRTEIKVDLKHPRDRKSKEFGDLVDTVYTIISNPEMSIESLVQTTSESDSEAEHETPRKSEVFVAPDKLTELDIMTLNAQRELDLASDVSTSEPLSDRSEVAQPLKLESATLSEPLREKGPTLESSQDLGFSEPLLSSDRPGEIPYARLPEVRIGSVAGLLSFLEDDDEVNELASLGQSLQLDVDDLVPLVEAASLLGLMTLDQDNVKINERGKRFLQSSIDERKSMVRESIIDNEKVKLIGQIYRLLRRSKQSRIPQELLFDTILLKHYSSQKARTQLETAIEWGRFAELFGYNAPTGELFLDEESTLPQND